MYAVARLPTTAKVAWISTRRALVAADKTAGNILGTYVPKDMLAHLTAPLQELSTAGLAVLEVPPVTEQKFEHDLFNLVYKIRNMGPEVLLS